MGLQELLSGVAFTSLLMLCTLIHALVLAEAVGRYWDRIARRYGEAEQKALVLLKEWLSPGQLAQYESDGHFEVRGLHSGKRYRIRRDRRMNIDELNEHGAPVAIWCFGPEGYLPVGDFMLAQKIALENDERAALAVAKNREP